MSDHECGERESKISDEQMSNWRGKAVQVKDPPQPDYTKDPPKNWIKTTRRRDEVLYVAGHGCENPDVVFAMGALLEEDAVEERYTSFSGDRTLKEPPEYCKGMNGSILKDIIDRTGIDATSVWYTAVVKWLLPRAKRTKPDRASLKFAEPSFLDELRKLKPKLVVCMGKTVFDILCPIKIKADDIKLGIMYHKELDLHYVLVDPVHVLSSRPDYVEQMTMELTEVSTFVKQIRGVSKPKLPWRYSVLSSKKEVEDWVDNVACNHNWFAVDCEWGGNTFIDGALRTIQFCWNLEDSVVIRFMDAKGDYTMDASYEEIGAILGRHLNKSEVGYFGHHVAADFVWMRHWLNLETHKKCILDTEFAQQVLYEHVPLGLEHLTMMYTDLGKYDLDLVLWKKENPLGVGEGYAYVPDEILLPYACLRRDALVQLGDGKWERIGKLVEEKYSGEVMSLVGNEKVPCKVTNWHKTLNVGQKWYGIRFADQRSGPNGYICTKFTPDHRVLTKRGKVEVQHLVPGEDGIATPHKRLSYEQTQVILGMLLGDGGVAKRNNAWCGIHGSQSDGRHEYLKWKGTSLSNFGVTYRRVPASGCRKELVSFSTKYSPVISEFVSQFHRHTYSDHAHRRIKIDDNVLEELGPISMAVWYQDDGSLDSDNFARLYFKDVAGDAYILLNKFRELFGPDVSYYGKGCNRVFVFGSKDCSRRLWEYTYRFAHPDCAYKYGLEFRDKIVGFQVPHSDEIFYRTVDGVFEIPRNQSDILSPKQDKYRNDWRFCLTVEGSGNFLTKDGFVSNCQDVVATFRIAIILYQKLIEAGTWEYYHTIFNPFVTDTFTDFCYYGLPVDIPKLDELREVYMFARDELDTRFRKSISEEAKFLFVKECMELKEKGVEISPSEISGWLLGLLANEDGMEMLEKHVSKGIMPASAKAAIADIKQKLGAKLWPEFSPFVTHLLISDRFNIRSGPSMRRWLFEVKRFTPVKSTNQKNNCRPSMAWEKVLDMPPEVRKEYLPAVDKQTLQILGDTTKDEVIKELLNLNAVGNVLKAFLKPAEYDDEGELVRENGLRFWVCSDGRIHPNYSTFTHVMCLRSLYP